MNTAPWCFYITFLGCSQCYRISQLNPQIIDHIHDSTIPSCGDACSQSESSFFVTLTRTRGSRNACVWVMLSTTNPFLGICMQICFCGIITTLKIWDLVTLSPPCLCRSDSFRTLEVLPILSDFIPLWETIWAEVNKVQNWNHPLIRPNMSHINLTGPKKKYFKTAVCTEILRGRGTYSEHFVSFWLATLACI